MTLHYITSNFIAIALLSVMFPNYYCIARDTKNISQVSTPFIFIENKGQIIDQNENQRTDIDFKLQDKSFTVFVGDAQIHYQWHRSHISILDIAQKHLSVATAPKQSIETYRLDMKVLGANKNATLVLDDVDDYYENYYLPQCTEGAIARSFKKATYQNIYPGIDWIIYIGTGQDGRPYMKYDFIVRPGYDARQIKLEYTGADSLILADGNISIYTPFGKVTENKPYCYDAETLTELNSRFLKEGNVISFVTSSSENDLVIDPILYWGTYYNLSGSNGAEDAICNIIGGDKFGNGYLGGFTFATNNIATFGTHQATINGNFDCFIVKMTPAGAREWGTYFGGEDYDYTSVITTDTNGYIYLAGETYSKTGIVTSGSHQTTFSIPPPNPPPQLIWEEAYLVKFNGSGQRVWATYYGGIQREFAKAVTTDVFGNVYLGGNTRSTTNIASGGAFQTSFDSGFVVKFNAAGTRQWGSYYPGMVQALACDTSANLYIGGRTTSYYNVSTSGSHQPTNAAGTVAAEANEGFLTKFDKLGHREWGTYYGGFWYDEVTSMACDKRGNVYIGGNTNSPNSTSFINNTIATPNTHSTQWAGWQAQPQTFAFDGFIAKFSPSGSRYWGTYFGGLREELLNTILLDPSGKIWICGNTNDSFNISTADAYKRIYTPSPKSLLGPPEANLVHDAFLAEFNQNGKQLYGTYYGGDSTEYYTKIAYSKGRVYLGGSTISDTGIATAGAYNPTSKSYTGYITLFDADTFLYIDQFIEPVRCLGDSFKIYYGVTNIFRTGNTFTVQLSNSSGSFVNPLTIGTKTSNESGFIDCFIPLNTAPGSGYKLRLLSNAIPDTSWDYGETFRIAEYPRPGPVAINPICANGVLQLVDSGKSPSTTNYEWTGPGGLKVGFQTYIRPNVKLADAGYYILTANNFGCIRKDSINVTVYFSPAKPSITGKGNLCAGDTLKIKTTTSTVHPDISWNWQKPSGFVENGADDTTINNVTTLDAGLYRVIAVLHGCFSEEDTLHVVVMPSVTPTLQIGTVSGKAPGPWAKVDFSATGFSNQGVNPTYQWTKNGVAIPGATTPFYSATTMSDIQAGDYICINMTSNAQCANPKTVSSCMTVMIDLDVHDKTTSQLRIYPNPTNDYLNIEGAPEKSVIRVLDMIGREVYRDIISKFITQVNTHNLAPGAYILQITTLNLDNTYVKFLKQ